MNSKDLDTLGGLLHFGANQFDAAGLTFGHGTNNAWDEMVLLALAVLNLPPEVDNSVEEKILTPDEKAQLLKLIQQRIEKRLPAAYLTQSAYLEGLKFYVDPHVMIPRSPIAKCITPAFSPYLAKPPTRILDLCTGSGCLAILCAKKFPQAKIDAVDICENALKIAEKNAKNHQVFDQIQFIHSNLFSALGQKRYDIILSNPPYVSQQEYDTLPQEYYHEPKIAFLSQNNGLALTEKILQQASNFLKPQGFLIVEVGNSKETLVKQYPKYPFIWLEFEQAEEGVFLVYEQELSRWR